MPALQVRDFPEHLYEELRICAQREYRSIAQQTIVAVQDYLTKEGKRLEAAEQRAADLERLERIEQRRQVFERIDSRPPFEAPEGFPTPQQIIRELRDSR